MSYDISRLEIKFPRNYKENEDLSAICLEILGKQKIC